MGFRLQITGQLIFPCVCATHQAEVVTRKGTSNHVLYKLDSVHKVLQYVERGESANSSSTFGVGLILVGWRSYEACQAKVTSWTVTVWNLSRKFEL